MFSLSIAFRNKIYLSFKTFNFGSAHRVYSSRTTLTNIPAEGRSFRVGEKERVLVNWKPLNDLVGKISREGSETRDREATPNCEQSWEIER